MNVAKERGLARLVRRQHGCITTAQVEGLQITATTARRILARRFRRVHRGVYVSLDHPDDRRSHQVSAILALGGELRTRRVALAGTDAARVLGLPIPEGCGPSTDDPVHVVTTVAVTTRHEGIRLERVRTMPRLITCEGLPVCRTAVVVADLVRQWSPPTADRFVDDMLRRRPALWSELHEEALGAAHRVGVGKLRALLHRLAEATHAESERRALAALDDAGLAGLGRTQVPIRDAAGLIRVADWASKVHRVALEVNGWAWHSLPDRFERDHRVRQRLLAAGWVLVEVTALQAWHESTTIAPLVREALAVQAARAA